MTFSGKELVAIISVAKKMVMADEKVEPGELAVMSAELMRFGVQQKQLSTLFIASDNMESSLAIALIAGMDDERKKYVASYLGTIMAADGDIDDRELVLWQLVSTLCDLPTMSVGDAISNMKNL